MIKNKLIKIDGFLGNGINTKVKEKNLDLGIIHSKFPCIAAGAFTTNKACAAPVTLSKEYINNEIYSIIINSGNANACTGPQGMKDAIEMCKLVGDELNTKPENTLICSTGIIGKILEMDKISKGIKTIVTDMSLDNFDLVSEAIITTDLTTKVCSSEFVIDGKTIKINGMSKGSGMIHPNMATMLGFVTTDINIEKKLFQKVLKDIVDDTFNMISVDGDTSTNDTVLMLSNKLAGNDEIISEDDENFKIFKSNLYNVIESLAIQIARDGEGATKLLTVNLNGAMTKEDARIQAKSVITSSLVKSAFFGEDPNWGRILSSIGSSPTNFDPEKIFLSLKDKEDEIILMDKGMPTEFNIEKAKKILANREIEIYVDINLGEYNAYAWGCDLSYDYVKINAMYST